MKRPVTAGYEGPTSQFENNNERRADTEKENGKKRGEKEEDELCHNAIKAKHDIFRFSRQIS